MFRPIVRVAVAFAAGITLGRWSFLSAWAWLALSGVCAAAAACCLTMRRSAAVPMRHGTLAPGALSFTHRATLDALQAVGAAVYRTDLDGAVTVTSDGSRLGVQTVRRSADR